jgi:hypothetical protein
MGPLGHGNNFRPRRDCISADPDSRRRVGIYVESLSNRTTSRAAQYARTATEVSSRRK